MKERAVDGEQPAVGVDRRAHGKMLLARMVRRHQVLAAVLDPFHRTIESERGETDEHVLRVEFAADAEAAADMAFVQMYGGGRAVEHAREAIPVPVQHFGGAVHFKNAARHPGDGAARLQRHAGVAADGEIERDDGVRSVKGRVDVAKAFAQRGDLGRMVVVEFARLAGGVEQNRQIGDVDVTRSAASSARYGSVANTTATGSPT